MVNNYLEFSEIIENLTPQEIEWWESEAKLAADHVNDDPENYCYDFAVEKTERSVWFHANKSGDPEAVATIVQKFLEKFRPKDHFTLTWANWCSEPRIGEFDGGAIFVTANEIKVHSAYNWIAQILVTRLL